MNAPRESAPVRFQRRLHADSHGTALVEFALVLPLLLLVVVGILDFGLLFQQYQVLTNAVREGARIAVLPGYGPADVTSRINAYLSAGGVPTTVTPVVQPSIFTPAGGPCFSTMVVTVQMPYTFRFLGPIGALFGSSFGTVTLPATSVMRTEAAAGGC